MCAALKGAVFDARLQQIIEMTATGRHVGLFTFTPLYDSRVDNGLITETGFGQIILSRMV
jgi:hypothetical protein